MGLETRIWIYSRYLFVIISMITGQALAQNPCDGRGACDALLINKGRPWDYQIGIHDAPRSMAVRTPDAQEQKIVDSLERIFKASSIRGVALLNGDALIHSALKDGISEQALFYGLSVGKTVTAIAAGQAICQNLITLQTKVGDVLPEFANTDMGKASLQNLLTMSSGTWEGLRDANVATQEQFRDIWAGQLSIRDLMLQPKVNTAEKDLFGKPRQPGSTFSYRN